MGARPTWQQDECPGWCVAVHHEDDHPHDRKHTSAVRVVPVVQLTGPGEAGRDQTKATQCVVVVHRRDGTNQIWVYVGDGTDQRIEATAESWQRLIGQVSEMLAAARDP